MSNSDAGRWAVFRQVFLSHFVLCAFFGLLVLEVLDPAGDWGREWNVWEHVDEVVLVAGLNGLVLAALVWLIHLRRRRKINSGREVLFNVLTDLRHRRMAVVVGFLAGALDVVFFLAPAGVFVLTVITVALVVVHLRRFGRRIMRLLAPGQLPTWGDVGQLAHVYATMIAAFSLMTVSLFMLHYYRNLPSPFSSAVEIKSFVDAFYFAVVVMTTLGFGDVVPVTLDARLFVAIECLTSYVMFALMVGVITRGIVHKTMTQEDAASGS